MVCLIAAAIAGAFAPAAAAERGLLAHAAGDSLWVAAVVSRPADSYGPPAGNAPASPSVLTQIWARPSQPGKPWRLLTVLPGRVTSMGSRDTQLAVLMAGGQWMTVYDGGSASGQPLPAGGRLVTLADDGHGLWAVGVVRGGIAKARADLDRMAAATQASSSDQPYALTTRPTTAAAPTDAASDLAAPVVFRQDGGRWAAVAELPPGMTTEELSVVVVGRTPTVAARVADGSIRISRWHDGNWDEVGRFHPGGQQAGAAFALVSNGNGTALWLTPGGTDPGTIRPLATGAAEPDVRQLKWVGPPPLTATPAVAVAAGYLRVIGVGGAKVNEPGKPYEQRYEMNGTPVGGPTEVLVPSEGDTTFLVWVQGLLLASLAFAIGTSVYRQVTPGSALNAGAKRDDDAAAADVAPAPLGARAAAGAIDLLPLAGCALVALVTAARHPEPTLPAGIVWLLVTGVAIYLAHTTLLEALTARTAGKWMTGLRVATLDGGRPAVWQLVARNGLRVLDPLVWIVLSPLRQRTADVLAGTIVVREAAPASPAAEPPSPPTEPGT